MKEKTKAYMAALMDGEGTFCITSCIHNVGKHKLFDPTIAIHITDESILKWCIEHFGGSIYKRKPTEGKKQDWDWRTDSYKHSANFINLIRKYLVMKRREADVLLEFYSLFRQQVPEKRQELCDKLKALKDRRALTTETQDFLWSNNLINAYFAAFFDGEGSTVDSNHGTTVRLTLGNTVKPILDVMQTVYGGHVYPMAGESRPDHHAPMFQWQLDRQADIEKTLLGIIPYMVIKREAAIEKLEFIRNKKIQSELARERKSAPTETLAAQTQ